MDTQVRLGKDSIGYINNNNKEDELQKVFIECLGSTNLYAIQECISFLEDLPFEIIESVLKRTSGINFPNWNYAKEILNDYVKRKIDTLEKVEADKNRFKKGDKTKNTDTAEYKEVTFESEEDYQRKVLGKWD